jgi:hypothetical protein
MVRLFLKPKVLSGMSGKKLEGDIPVIYFDYFDNLKIDGLKYVRLIPFSRLCKNRVLEAYFTGYEGISKKLKCSAVIPELVQLFERYYIVFRNMIDEHNIKAIVLTGLVGIYEAALLQLSLDRGIPVFCCQHGIYYKLYPSKKLLKNVRFFASGNEECKLLFREGIPLFHVYNTGSPFFDGILEYKKKSRKRYIVILAQPLCDNEIDVDDYKNCLSLIKARFPGSHVVVKLHPRDLSSGIYRRLGFKVSSSLSRKGLYRLLASARCVYGFESTAELESMMLGVPVIVHDGVRFNPIDYPYKKIKVKDQKKYIEDNFILDGKSKERIWNILCSYR